MNTVQIKNTIMPLTAEERAYLLNGISAVGQDRAPFANARIKGNSKNKEVIGEARFYHTPLGVLVSVWIKGFESKRQTYNIGLVDSCGRKQGSCVLPPLYERGGYAFFSSLTGKLTPGEIFNNRISVSRYGTCGYDEVAYGHIEPAILKKEARIV